MAYDKAGQGRETVVGVEIIIPTPDFEAKIKILHAVDRPIEQLSLEEICARAGISRQTFYKHFDSKYSIGLWYSNFCNQYILFQVGRRYSWHDALEMHFAMLCKELDFLTRSVTGNLRKQLGDEQRLTLREEWSRTLAERGAAGVDREMAFYVATFSSILVESTGAWLMDSGEAVPVEEHLRWVENCIPRPLYQAMNGGL